MPSVFQLIDEQGGLGSNGNDENLFRRIQQTYLAKKQNPHIKEASKFNTREFLVSHYAGDVAYDVTGFVEKNKDVLSDYILETLQQSAHPLMQKLFAQVASSTAKLVRRGSKIGGFSLSSQFTDQLNELVFMINYSVPKYVRCIKPNNKASAGPADFDEEIVKE